MLCNFKDTIFGIENFFVDVQMYVYSEEIKIYLLGYNSKFSRILFFNF
jgi:hypothetical protein